MRSEVDNVKHNVKGAITEVHHQGFLFMIPMESWAEKR